MEPAICVGIQRAKNIEFVFNDSYCCDGKEFLGLQEVLLLGDKISFNGRLYTELLFESSSKHASFQLKDVIIGVSFHWERKEDQVFKGSLKIIVSEGELQTINIIGLEDYLTSVISSEMSATASLSLLKAHAVISRSWLFSQIEKKRLIFEEKREYISSIQTDREIIKWYDREEHKEFDVCADDHCQRYQGITKTYSNIGIVNRAISETYGEMLIEGDSVCDARFSKCCGGVVEEYQTCWEDTVLNYSVARRDLEDSANFPDLRDEHNARSWILTHPNAYCNTTDKKILGQVLNNYDQETTDFYRWQVVYLRQDLSDLVRRKSGIDFGDIQDLVPIKRGASGRIIKLKIIGSKQTMIVGKELEIRKYLSESHLYSSAFVIEKDSDYFYIHGAGWGHGVGLCQIGAAVMAENGIDYKNILFHYYPNTEIKKYY